MKLVSAILAALVLLVSCQTSPGPIGPEASAEVYFQRAQAASDQGQYDEALALYRAFLADRPDADREYVFSARYEVAFLLAKKRQDVEAIAGFEALLADYNDFEKSAGAPGWVKVLSQKKLQELKDRAPKAKA